MDIIKTGTNRDLKDFCIDDGLYKKPDTIKKHGI